MPKLALEAFLPYRMTRIGSEVSAQFRSIYGPEHDLTIPEWRVLATLGQFGEVSAKVIGRHSGMHKTKVSRAVSTLDGRRWLRRTQNGTDRREEILTLTPAGRRAYEAIVPKALAFEKRILSELGTDAATFLAAVGRLERILGLSRER
jgi:DNA-binding MarR family transcriptional regulator